MNKRKLNQESWCAINPGSINTNTNINIPRNKSSNQERLQTKRKA